MKFVSPLLGAMLVILTTACDRKPAVIPPQPSADSPADPGTAVAVAQAERAPQEAQDRRNEGGNRPDAGANFQQRADERLQRMKTELGLTEDQAQKIRAVFEQQSASLRQQMGDSSGSREERRAAFQQSRTAANTEIGRILTPEQMTRWTAMQREWEQRRMERRQDGN